MNLFKSTQTKDKIENKSEKGNEENDKNKNKAKEKEKEKEKEDCIFCRVTGSIIFGSFSVYSFLKFIQARKKSADKIFFGFVTISFGTLFIYRAFTPAVPIISATSSWNKKRKQ